MNKRIQLKPILITLAASASAAYAYFYNEMMQFFTINLFAALLAFVFVLYVFYARYLEEKIRVRNLQIEEGEEREKRAWEFYNEEKAEKEKLLKRLSAIQKPKRKPKSK